MQTQNIAPVAETTTAIAATETTTAKTKKTGPARKGRKVVDVDVKVEAEATVAVVETLPEAPKAEAPVVETWACSITGETRTIDKMLVPKLGTIDKELGHRTTEADLRTRAVSVKGALKKNLDREELMFLDVALEIVRKDDEKAAKAKQAEEARVEKAKKLAAFRASVFIGQPKVGEDGKTYFRCVQGKMCAHTAKANTAFVGSADIMQAPSLEDMQMMNWDNRRGRMVTASDLAHFYVLCPECAKHLIENPQSAKNAEQEINQDLESNGDAYAHQAEMDSLHSKFYQSPEAQQGRRFNKKPQHNRR